MIDIEIDVAHRLLAPRLVGLFGAGSKSDATANIIPASNFTSVGVEPELVCVALYKEWDTTREVHRTQRFTVSIPRRSDVDLVWKMGAAYSHYRGDGSGGKVPEFINRLDRDWSSAGPVLEGAISWLECRVLRSITDMGDHEIFMAEVTKAAASNESYDSSGKVVADFETVMQVVGNKFSTSSPFFELEFF